MTERLVDPVSVRTAPAFIFGMISALSTPSAPTGTAIITRSASLTASPASATKLSTRLSDGGRICLQLHSGGSDADTFKPMVEEAGLKITATMESVQYQDIYYMEVQK